MRDFEVINENLRNALAAFSFVRRSGETAAASGVSLVYSGTAHSLFNTALLVTPVPGECGDFRAVLDRAEEYFKKRSVPWSVWFSDDFFTAEERRRSRIALATRGLRLMMETPGMIAAEALPPRDPLPVMEYQSVRDLRTRLDFSGIMSSAFNVPENMSHEVYAGETLWEGPMRGWVAYRNGVATSTAATVMSETSIGIYAVATHPRQQRMGYGEAVMRHALRQAQEETGIKCTILQSSAAGYPLYVRMGYRSVTRFAVYVRQ